MNKTSSKHTSKAAVKHQFSETDDSSDDDIIDTSVNEYMQYAMEDERASKKFAARRKIDMYMEKKRLREELNYSSFDDF
ncbi:hypothetical protein AU255_11595 [Methyloprofundus sedimenti]|uniref:Uncharacterized protein n=1 Tax=Methyloprofundus sedimenti TaxID=1420851 RepID=A0A1V8MA68_9GAMM|nr:hypothetical protein [Methyloprofundus sedimenti]OQK18426.1 hypothetical protein AU255_11595 [Methyloprofundus sedimenti]